MVKQQDVTTILPLESQASAAIEALLDEAFGADRHGRTAYAIRTGMSWLPSLSLACLDDAGAFVGLLQSWPVALHADRGSTAPLVMVGPVAVLPDRQGEGYGRALMDALMDRARTATDTPPLIMIGDPEYYGRFWGFSADQTGGWRTPGPVDPRRLLAVSLHGHILPGQGMLGPRVAQTVR